MLRVNKPYTWDNKPYTKGTWQIVFTSCVAQDMHHDFESVLKIFHQAGDRGGKCSKYTVWYDDKRTMYRSSVEVKCALRLRDLASDSDVQTAIASGGTTTESEC